VCGRAGDISASEKVRPRYMMAMMMVAKNMEPKPCAKPRFQPE
jgi:hypothetical protein